MNANSPTPEIVGPTGEVVALERSGNFIRAIDATCRAPSLPNLKIHELDLMTDDLPGADYDFAWSRWVISFVSDPALLIRKLVWVMPKGSVYLPRVWALRHLDILPAIPMQERFREHVIAT